MHIIDIANAVIYKNHGWAVAEQFDDTIYNYSRKNLQNQNINALSYILDELKDLCSKNSDTFTEDALDEMQDYMDALEEHLNSEDEDEDEDESEDEQ